MAEILKARVFGTNFLAASKMISQGSGGRIINISSVHEDWPNAGHSSYCISKRGMRMLTGNAALELAKVQDFCCRVGLEPVQHRS